MDRHSEKYFEITTDWFCTSDRISELNEILQDQRLLMYSLTGFIEKGKEAQSRSRVEKFTAVIVFGKQESLN